MAFAEKEEKEESIAYLCEVAVRESALDELQHTAKPEYLLEAVRCRKADVTVGERSFSLSPPHIICLARGVGLGLQHLHLSRLLSNVGVSLSARAVGSLD